MTPGACYVSTSGRRAILLHPSSILPDAWRLTSWDYIGPSGHQCYNTREEALHALRDRAVSRNVFAPDEPTVLYYKRTTRVPSWLGTTVITGGVVLA